MSNDLALQISSLAGVISSLLFAYVPIVKDLYEELSPKGKGLFMVILGAVAAVVLFAVSCLEIKPYTTCDYAGLGEVASAFIAFLVANQATYLAVSKHAQA